MNLNEWFKETRYKQYEFAKMIGVTPVAVSNWLKGKRIPKYKTFKKIKEITGGKVTYEEMQSQIQSDTNDS